MNKQTGLILFAVMTLTACAGTPSRQAGSQAPVPVVEAQTLQLGSSSQPISNQPITAGTPTTTPATPSGGQPGRGGYLEGDGPGDDVPANLDATPDAVPRAEPLHPYANRQYVALGQTYTPLAVPGNYKERGIASWYGKKFHGQRTSSGEVYDMYGMTAAHPTLPIPSYARVTNLANNKSVIVRINDRGPFLHDRIMDLSYVAAHKLGIVGNGSSEVEVTSLAPDAAVATSLAVTDTVTSEPLTPGSPVTAPVATKAQPAGGNFYLQLGAFKSKQGAESFLAKMRPEFDGSGTKVSLFEQDGFVRVHAGPYASENEARAIVEKLQAKLGVKPLVKMH